MLFLGSILTSLILAVALVLAAAVAGVMGYHYVQARLRERRGIPFEPAVADAADAEAAERARAKSAEEIAQIRARIEALMDRQQLQHETQSQHLAQQLDTVNQSLQQQDRKLDGLRSEVRHELRRHDGELTELRQQLAHALDAFWKATPIGLPGPDGAPLPLPPAEAAPPEPPVAPATAQPAEPVWPTAPMGGDGSTPSPVTPSPAPPAHPAEAKGTGFAEDVALDAVFLEDVAPPAPPPASFAEEVTPVEPIAWEDPFAGMFLDSESEAPAAPPAAPLASPTGPTPSVFAPMDAYFEDAPAAPPAKTPEPPKASPSPPVPAVPAQPAAPVAVAPPMAPPAVAPPASAAPPPPASAAPPPPPPAGADDLTVVSGIDQSVQQKLYALGVVSLDEMARWSRADARRISASLDVPEDTIMHQWIFEAQSVLFDRYQQQMGTPKGGRAVPA
ncbi:MAG TPA: hypothetical protein VD962_05925 [Rubricoccaceae bacterium]|nr:hypothetical protein [Rubricoccaceae bacterium]